MEPTERARKSLRWKFLLWFKVGQVEIPGWVRDTTHSFLSIWETCKNGTWTDEWMDLAQGDMNEFTPFIHVTWMKRKLWYHYHTIRNLIIIFWPTREQNGTLSHRRIRNEKMGPTELVRKRSRWKFLIRFRWSRLHSRRYSRDRVEWRLQHRSVTTLICDPLEKLQWENMGTLSQATRRWNQLSGCESPCGGNS